MIRSKFKHPILITSALTIVFSAFIVMSGLLLLIELPRTGLLPMVGEIRVPVISEKELIVAHTWIFVVCAVVFLIWTHRVSKNLQFLKVKDLKLKPRWAVGWFFVPFASLFLPHDIFMEIWRGSSSPTSQHEQPEGLISVWWWTYVSLGLLSAQSLNQKSSHAVLVPEYLFYVVGIISAALTLTVIFTINRMQSARFTTISAAQPHQTEN